MSDSNKLKVFLVSIVTFVILMAIASFGDLAISNTLIDYNNFFGATFQSFGEFPLALVFIISGQIAMHYASRNLDNKLFALPTFIGGLSLSLWQLRQYLKEAVSYGVSWATNLAQHKPIGLANSDAATKGLSSITMFVLWLAIYLVITVIIQWWLHSKSNQQIKQLLLVAIFASLAVWFALQVNGALKEYWGRVRPYELNKAQSDFTPWFHPNGANGHKSFPSGHTMAGTTFIVLSWFVGAAKRKYVWIAGIIYGALMGLSRVVIGAHFMSDVVFSFFLTGLIYFIMRELYNHLIANDEHKYLG
ncbi:phosphatase PAP2 family protein [Periweissella fabalis]|uniref:Phosphatase PAP2 family protein n=1 Tax=Periweissella fabalis TaxID=1070421 RepID=A0A7X6S317_9LACO|nr:phosphatase PAP2 family protein [Periweissella fabalis]MCM0599412.1 phosphatase PAP2 family protein [Periweissella fabalis]NKZ23691.1 phosphatase PAP2 family protein [Periweissella fabalis]